MELKLKPVRKKKKNDDSVNEAVQETLKDLKELHSGSSYTPFQFRIWAEMLVGGVHHSPLLTQQCFCVLVVESPPI